MRTFICSSCRHVMPANPRVKNQRYCGKAACQRERKRKWQQAKMATDADYRVNQHDAQKAWSEHHHDYWHQRRLTRRAPLPLSAEPDATPVKMDASARNFNLIPGRYIMTPIGPAGRKMDALMVKIVPLSTG